MEAKYGGRERNRRGWGGDEDLKKLVKCKTQME